MEVVFLHNRSSSSFRAQVDPATTGEACLRGLIEAGFLAHPPAGQPYGLVHSTTHTQILPAMTMEEAGVHDGDSILVTQMEQGARGSAVVRTVRLTPGYRLISCRAKTGAS